MTTAVQQQQLFTQSVVNAIGGTAATAPQVGYLDKNKTLLQVEGTLSSQDPTDYFSFDFRSGSNLNMSVSGDKGVRVQLLDGSGTRVLADSSGTNISLNQVFANLKTGNGVAMKNGNYILKVTYDQGTSKDKNLNYTVTLSSGTTASSVYRTSAYATTIMQTLNAGGTISGYSSLTEASSVLTDAGATTTDYMTGEVTTTPLNILDYLA
jgi:hypothetical protein